MTIVRFGAGLAALVLGAQALVAQQPAPQQGGDRPPMGRMGAQDMRMMDSLNARLDTLVARMNQATGNRKMAAMAGVLNEMVAQRKMMQQHMRQMMESRSGMMDRMKERAPGEKRPTKSTPDSASADTGHAEHHPQE